jgi:S-adenosylmethionine:tRNA-ribosyltransferase-isomerase (queuine synthetase)
MNLVDSANYTMNYPFNFTLPTELEASEPPEIRGLARDEVRLMISYRASNRVIHTQFVILQHPWMLVINTSGTLNAALQAKRVYGTHYANHIFQRSSLHSLKPRVYAAESGSAEMPSAGRAFTLELITRLVAQGVQIAPLILHTGLSFEIMGRGSLSRNEAIND